MNYSRVFIYLISYVLSIIGIKQFFDGANNCKKNYSAIKKHMMYFNKQSKEEANVFNERMFVFNCYNISFEMYDKLRKAILISGILMCMLKLIVDGFLDPNLILIPSIVYTLMATDEKICGLPTITYLLAKMLENRFKKDIDAEIHSMVTYLRGMALSNQTKLSNPISIVEGLIPHSKISKPLLQKLLDFWQIGEVEMGVNCFTEYATTDLSKKFAALLIKLESLSIAELTNYLMLIQETYREVQLTKASISIEQRSSQIYIPVVLSALLILFNFIYITIYLTSVGNLSMGF